MRDDFWAGGIAMLATIMTVVALVGVGYKIGFSAGIDYAKEHVQPAAAD